VLFALQDTVWPLAPCAGSTPRRGSQQLPQAACCQGKSGSHQCFLFLSGGHVSNLMMYLICCLKLNKVRNLLLNRYRIPPEHTKRACVCVCVCVVGLSLWWSHFNRGKWSSAHTVCAGFHHPLLALLVIQGLRTSHGLWPWKAFQGLVPAALLSDRGVPRKTGHRFLAPKQSSFKGTLRIG
jgi:hypothetical protein